MKFTSHLVFQPFFFSDSSRDRVNPHFQSVSTPDGPKRCGVSVHPRKRDAIEMPLKNWWMFCELRPGNIFFFLTQKKKTDFGCFVKKLREHVGGS